MKKINSFILFGAAVFAFAACSEESQEEFIPKNYEPVYETLSVKVGTEGTTRATLATDAPTAAFETGDKIAVWTEAGSFQTCAVDGSGNITVNISSGVRSNYAVYYNGDPSLFTPTFDGSALTITLPSEYDYADVCGDKNPVPMVAKNVGGDAADMTFYAVCGLARISLSGIPATANKLEVKFTGRKVTGAFTVTDPGTNSPSITIGSVPPASATPVTINLTPGTDYTGAVINIPVPVGYTSSITVTAKNGDNTIVTKSASAYAPARATGKKLTVALTPTIYSMTFTKGNLYTEGGTLKIASNWYSNIYNDNSDTYVEATYSASNRSHFNFNETAAMMNNLPGSYDVAPDAGTFTWTTASANVGSFENKYVVISGHSYRVPTNAEWTAITSGTSRPGAYLSNDGGSTYTDGWKFVKVLVTDMEGKGTSNSDGTAYEANSDYQAGLLLFPDNVKITGTFATLGTKNGITTVYASTTITKGNLEALITAGCAFLPSVGRWASGSFGQVGIGGYYWSSTQSNGSNGYWFLVNASEANMGNSGKSIFRSVRLVSK